MKLISIVIPLFNEKENLPVLYKSLTREIKSVTSKPQYEIIFVNDGSTDDSLETIKKLASKHPHIRLISFRKNQGKSAALDLGFKKSRGEVIITLDADLQDGPENIPALLDKFNEGFDLVVGWKKKRFDSFSKRLASIIFNITVRLLSGIPLHDFNSGLKVMNAKAAKEIKVYGELHRFIPYLIHIRGYRVTEIPVIHHARLFGRSKYGWTRLHKGFFDFITVFFMAKFGSRPLHFFGTLSAISLIIGIGIGMYLSFLRFRGESIGRRPLLFLSVLLIIVGLQMMSIGLMAEMIVKNTKSAEQPPIDYETKN